MWMFPLSVPTYSHLLWKGRWQNVILKKNTTRKRIKSLNKSCISSSTFPKGRRNAANNMQVEKISKTSTRRKRFSDNVKLRKNTKYKPKYSKTAKSFRYKSHSRLWKLSHWMLFLKIAVILNLEYNTPMLQSTNFPSEPIEFQVLKNRGFLELIHYCLSWFWVRKQRKNRS